ncbi:MAG: hypothetical protein HRF45_01155 [Fimbriimonadia bacterium]|jgi:hypothetical protein
MIRRSIASIVLSLGLVGLAAAQWTAIPNDPSVWPYGDSIFTPTNSQVLNVYRTFTVFANGKFNILGGRSGTDYTEDGWRDTPKNWATTNRHSKMSLYDPVTNTWETASTQSQLVATSDTGQLDEDTMLTLSDLTGVIFPGDWIKVIAADDSAACYGEVESVTFADGIGEVKFVRRGANGVCYWWLGGSGDRFFKVTVSGLNGLIQWPARGSMPPFESHGYQSYTNMCAAWDTDADGIQEIFIFGGYPHWVPHSVDVYNYATNDWRDAGDNDYLSAFPGIDAPAPGGVQSGNKFYWITQQSGATPTWFKLFTYDLSTETWSDMDILNPGDATAGMPLMKHCEVVGDKLYVFWGWDGASPPAWLHTTLVVDLNDGTWVKKTPPPVTANQGAIVKYGQYIILLAGRTGGGAGSATDAIQIYDTVNDTWTVSSIKTPYKASTASAAIAPDGTIYFANGLNESVVWVNDAYKIHVSQLIPTTVTVTGKLGLEFHVNVGSVTGTLQVYGAGGGGLLETKSLTLDGSGNFSVDLGVAPGTYDLRFGAPNYLWKRLSNVSLSGGTNNVGTVNLICGDGNANNQIELGDLNQVLINFGGTGSGDYDGSGSVGLADLNIVLVNFGKAGDS